MMKPTVRLLGIATVALLLSVSLTPSLGYSFGESICYSDASYWYNCIGISMPSRCYDSQDAINNPSDECRQYAREDIVRITSGNITAKMEEAHYIIPYIIAQALGMRPEAAYWTAIYGSVPDFGEVFPVNKFGERMSYCQNLGTASFRGIHRDMNLSDLSAGRFIHWPKRFDSPTDAYAWPDFNDPAEGASKNFLDFALGQRQTACIAGVTDDSSKGSLSSSGTNCYRNDLRFTANPSASDPEKPLEYAYGTRAYTGDIILDFTKKRNKNGESFATNAVFIDQAQEVLSASAGTYLNGPVPAKLFYLALAMHVATDRISHAECIQSVPLRMHRADLVVETADAEDCHVDWHAWDHFVEFGTGWYNQKVASAISVMYDHIAAFLHAYPEFLGSERHPVPKMRLQRELSNISIIKQAGKRLMAYNHRIASYGFAPLPGHASNYRRGQCPSFFDSPPKPLGLNGMRPVEKARVEWRGNGPGLDHRQ